MDIHGYQWILYNGYYWILLDIHGYESEWILMDINGYEWI